jgi:superfamily II DNA or RNA helicase
VAPLQLLLEKVRKACLPAVWSQGVKLVRDKAVTAVAAEGAGRSESSGEVTLRVRAPGRAVAPTVTLYAETGEWSCDCDSKQDPCMHVAAAAIALAQAAEKGETLDSEPAAPKPPRLIYRLVRKEKQLIAVQRFIVQPDGREERFRDSLATDRARGGASGLVPTHDDMKVDRILGTPPRESILGMRMAEVLAPLSSAEVYVDGVRARILADAVGPRATVTDAPGGGFRLRLERDPSITEIVSRGLVRCGETLRPMGEMETTGELLERLPRERLFAKNETPELVTKVLPELEAKCDVVIATARLPRKAADARLRIAMDLSHRGHTLSVLPTLVYGDPPVARVEGNALVALGDIVPVRRPDAERELLRRLRDELHIVPGRRVDLDGAEAIRFATKLRDWQRSVGDDGQAGFENRPLRPRIVSGGLDPLEEGDGLAPGAFDIVFETAEGEDGAPPKRAEAAAVLRAWRDGLELVPLEGGGWAPLPADWLAKHGHLVADLLAARDDDKRLTPAALPTAGALCDLLDAPRPPQLARLAPLFEGFEGIPRARLPEGLQATLRVYQNQGVDWLSFLRDAELGGVLADDMGLGKTLQTLCVLRGRALVVCPKSVVYNWADEITRFRPSLRTAIYHGPKRELDPQAEVTLTTYALLRLDAQRLAEEEWDAVVLDEAQAIKNLGSQTARAAFELHAKFRVALSGTPVENRLEELWSAMHFANPGLLGGASDFQERYAGPIENGDPDAAARLRAKIRPFILRRTKAEVVPELPSRTDTVLHVELDEVERSVYDAVRVATKTDVAEKIAKGGSVLAVLEALLRLRQAACHPSLVPGQTAESSSKIERLLEALEESVSEGHKALVFSQWTSFLDLVEPALKQAGIAFTRLDGSTVDRGAVVGKFQDTNGPPVMLVSLKAGGTGLNLTAADHVFLLDPWWNPAVEDQAASRAHRIGQDRPVMVHRMVAKDTVEERILALQEKKRRIADVALGDADHAGGITRAELLALLD